jgi:UDP-N-acetylglucosamine 2-epimerase (non-hydrolysing)
MIDSLVALLPEARQRNGPGRAGGRSYVVVKLHRPSNVDDPATLRELVDGLTELGAEREMLFPVQPRTRPPAGEAPTERVTLLDPVPYLDMLRLVLASDQVITDSGGLQQETSFLGMCLTVRPNTERPITCTAGTNRLVAPNREAIHAAACAAWGRTGIRRPPSSVGTGARRNGSEPCCATERGWSEWVVSRAARLRRAVGGGRLGGPLRCEQNVRRDPVRESSVAA